MRKKECKHCNLLQAKLNSMNSAYANLYETRRKDRLQVWLNFVCVMAFILLLFAFLAPFSWAETPNWQLFDSRIRQAADEFKTRWTVEDYDRELSGYYYDAGKTFEYLSRRYSDPSLLVTAQQAANFYVTRYADKAGYVVPGYWNFTTGLRILGYNNAVNMLAQNASYCMTNVASEPLWDTARSREVAYCIRAVLDARMLGYPFDQTRQFQLIAAAQSHLEQWANNTAPYLRPFMVGLTAYSVARYADEIEPLGIRERLQAVATKMKNELWLESARAFRYTDRIVVGPADLDPAPDLNLLIAPMYAWLGDKEFAGKVFNGGAEGAYLGNFDNMKQFNQNTQFIEEFSQWLNNATPTPIPTPSPTLTAVPTMTPSPSPTISPSPSPSPIPTPCQKSATGKLTLKYLDCRITRIKQMNNLEE